METTPFAGLVGDMALEPLGESLVDSNVVARMHPASSTYLHLHLRHGAMRCDAEKVHENGVTLFSKSWSS